MKARRLFDPIVGSFRQRLLLDRRQAMKDYKTVSQDGEVEAIAATNVMALPANSEPS